MIAALQQARRDLSVRIREAKQMATRRMSNEERAIVDAVDALKAPLHPCPHTDGIGPTHSDITADCVAKAFGVPIDSDPRALAILHAWVKTTGAEMNEARLRMTRFPKGADLILNKVSGAPGFWIGNVIVMAGVPSIMQAMLDEVAPQLKIGYPFFDPQRGPNTNVVLRAGDAQKLALAKSAVEDMLERVRRAQSE